ncbi:MAG: hypothetical protein HQK84_02265 [Nitrospinae bacterium]|nr:hypothetical protein [Nitrospinota bacterium]
MLKNSGLNYKKVSGKKYIPCGIVFYNGKHSVRVSREIVALPIQAVL